MHEWVDHTGELELHVRATTRVGVFAEASVALGDVLGDIDRDRRWSVSCG
jgi:SHS2 domain-containing protein